MSTRRTPKKALHQHFPEKKRLHERKLSLSPGPLRGSNNGSPTRLGTSMAAEVQQLRLEFQEAIATLSQQIQAIRPTQTTADAEDVPEPIPTEIAWESVLEALPTAPPFDEGSVPKLFKLAQELRRRSSLMTAGRDLHDITTVLHLAGHWTQLRPESRTYVAHRMRLLYIAITRGWPAALQYDQIGVDEFLDLQPEVWSNIIRPTQRSRPAPRTTSAARRGSATRRGRGRAGK
jgi:hypothetical protein